MKKRITFFAFAAALAFCYSCSNDETIASQATSESNEISFRPLTNGVTRATSLNLASLQANGFYVTATYTSGHTAYFSDQCYKEEASNVWKPWTGSAYTHIYWPTGDDVLDFHAYAPSDAQLVVSNANVATLNGCPEYTVTPVPAAASQVDFIYATQTGKDQNDGSMPLTFTHKESQIGVKLLNSDGSLKFTVSEIAICNIAQSGVFKNRDASPTTATTMGWGDFGSVTSYSQTSLSITKDGVAEATDAGTTWILIPHALANPTTDGQYASSDNGAAYNGAYIKVKYKCQNKLNESVYYAGGAESWAEGIWPISTNSSATTWTPGYYYTYTIDLKGGGYYETNQAEPSGATLDRILNLNEITFATVTVSDWTGPNNTNVGM